MKKILYSLLFLFPLAIYAQSQTVGLFLNDSLSQNGYTLFSADRNTYLVDNCGRQVNRWTSQYNAALSMYLLENGQLLRTASILGDLQGAGGGGRIELFAWSGELLWSYEYNDLEVRQHHDIEPLPNGNVLVLAWEVYTEEEALAAGRNPDLLDKNFWPDHIVELQPVGTEEAEIVWEWRAWDHLVQDFDQTKNNFGVIADHPELIDINLAQVRPINFPGVTGEDWMHSNGIAYNPVRDEIVLSVRNFSELIMIDHSTTTEEAASHSGGNAGMGGDIIYRWGNPANYGRGDTMDQVFFQQHDARWVPEGFPNAGQLMVFNNGKDRSPEEFSSVEWLAAPIDSDGQYIRSDTEAFGPATTSRSYRGNSPFYSSIMSGAQPLSNGNTLVCVSTDGRFIEVTPEDSIVWEYISPVGTNGPVPQGAFIATHQVFRATRYPTDYPAFVGRELSPGNPVELNPWPSDCVIYGDGPIANLEESETAPDFVVFENPFHHTLQLKGLPDREIHIEVYDLLGRPYYSQKGRQDQLQLDSSHWPSGLYSLHLRSLKGEQILVRQLIKI